MIELEKPLLQSQGLCRSEDFSNYTANCSASDDAGNTDLPELGLCLLQSQGRLRLDQFDFVKIFVIHA